MSINLNPRPFLSDGILPTDLVPDEGHPACSHNVSWGDPSFTTLERKMTAFRITPVK
jgi:hypothetical protein